jgi:hypothetical protein
MRAGDVRVGMLRSRFGIASALLLAALLAGCGGGTVQQAPPTTNPLFDSMAVPGAVVDARTAVSVVSDFRTGNGQSTLEIDPVLMRLAQNQANAMARADKLSHDLSGTPGNRARAVGYKFAKIAENVGAGHDTLADAFAGWRNSPGHRANMLMPGVTRFGIAVQQAPNSRYKVYWAMLVAEPAPVGGVPAAALASGGRWAGRWETFHQRAAAPPSHAAVPAPGQTVVTGDVPGGVQVTQ